VRRTTRYGRYAVAVLVAAALAAILLQASAAGTTTKPFAASIAPLTVGSGTQSLTLTITNNASQQSLGSANVPVPAGSGFTFDYTTSPTLSSGNVDATASSATVLALRNLNVPPKGGMLTATFSVSIPCSSSGAWNWAVRAKQSNDFNGPPGNDFTPTSQPSTTVTGGCALAWGTEPTSAVKTQQITGTPYTPTASAVTVRAVDGSGNTITTASGTVTLNITAGNAACPTSFAGFSGMTASLTSGVATFGSLVSSLAATGCQLYATATGYQQTPDSGPFNISLAGAPCTASGCPTVTAPLDKNTQLDAGASGSSFVFLAFGPAQIPANVTDPFGGGGCAGFQSVGAGVFDESDGGGTGTKTFRYSINKTLIQKKYGSNSGQQFIPICAGGAQIQNGHVTTCTSASDPNGWIGKTIDPTTGKFTSSYARAKCDPGTGLWWGILASFQDYNFGSFDPANTPNVTGWGSNSTYRWFDIVVPSPWDWRAGG